MPAITATAPGKSILFGEHAAVYGRPAIAVPVRQALARAVITANPRAASGEILVESAGIGLRTTLDRLPETHPLAFTIRSGLSALGAAHPPAFNLRITSTIPVASGLGSGAAVAVAVLRCLSAFLGHPFSREQVCSLAYEVEKIHHGTPSGIDNTVIAYDMPVYFVRGQPVETFQVPVPFTLVIADTGERGSTRAAVEDVRAAWEIDPAGMDLIFDRIAALTQRARQTIEEGRPMDLGLLMDENHELLCRIGVSSPGLDKLASAARSAGALGAKLSGGGQGGNMIALALPEEAPKIARHLESAGAVRTLITEIRS